MNHAIYDGDLRAACAGLEDAYAGKRFLITGATGLIGSFLADALMAMDRGVTVYAAGRSETGMRARFGDRLDDPRFHYVPYDATRPVDFDFDVDYVVHAACSAHPMAYATDPVGIMQANVIGAMQLLEYLRTQPGARMIFLSTGETYGENPDLPDGFRETDHGYINPMNPRSCYPESKRAAETLCACYAAQYGVHAQVARLCHVYGPTMTAANSRADAQFLRNALNGQDIVMKSTGAQVRSWCYAADAVNGILTLLQRGERGGATNVANRHSVHSIREYAQTLAEVGGVSLKFDLPPAVEQAGYSKITRAVLNPERLEALGWSAKYDLRTGLEHTYLCLR